MVVGGAARAARKLVGAVKDGTAQRRAKESVAALKAEYEAGRRGDDSPPTPLWAGPRQQLDAVLAALSSARRAADHERSDATRGAAHDDTAHDHAAEQALADEVGKVDWSAVRAATAERSAEAAATVREMAAKVDWERLQPRAAQVSSALISAVAAGRLPIGGPLGAQVARAIVNQGDLARRLSTTLGRTDTPVPADFGTVIEAAGRELPRGS
jgi:hypothetical protein